MINIDVPGYRKFQIKNIVFDYNGTLAVDGRMEECIRERLMELSSMVNVYILTADTYGDVGKECEGLAVSLRTFPRDNASKCKGAIVEGLQGESICVGNGFNDIEMFAVADLSVAVIGDEGCSGKLIRCSDIVVRHRLDVFNLFFNTDRIKATLRG